MKLHLSKSISKEFTSESKIVCKQKTLILDVICFGWIASAAMQTLVTVCISDVEDFDFNRKRCRMLINWIPFRHTWYNPVFYMNFQLLFHRVSSGKLCSHQWIINNYCVGKHCWTVSNCQATKWSSSKS